MNFFTVEILTPSSVVARNVPAESLLIPTVRGQINVLPEHTHLITKLQPGILSIMGGADDPDRHFTVTTGICKILKDKITILAETCEEDHGIDIERAKRALAFATDKLVHPESITLDEAEKYRRKAERAKLRIQITGFVKNRSN
jgi:F-type H+-transporting ATPase subunit epsilon